MNLPGSFCTRACPSPGAVESSCMTSDQLLARSKKQLADMARKQGIANWRNLRKEQLVKALSKARTKHTTRPPVKQAVNGRHALNGNGKAAKPAARPQRA